MSLTTPPPFDDPLSRLRLPPWGRNTRDESLEDAGFASGAVLATLHHVMAQPQVPLSLLRDRLALRAAEACVTLMGRPERASALRDEVHLLRPGDLPGPGGAIYQAWRQAVMRPMSAALPRALPDCTSDQITIWRKAGQGSPIAQCAQALEAVLKDVPHAESTALIISDAVLARALGWDHILPLLGVGLRPGDLRKTGDDLHRACHRAAVSAATEVLGMAPDLARRTARLTSITPKLRAKGARGAVELFLSQDAVAPAALVGLMSDRAARRLCDRLVDLGVVHELTGRETFRLYGV